MSYEKVEQAKHPIIGSKQTQKALHARLVDELYVARDAEPHAVEEVIALASYTGVAVVYVDSMKRLGRAANIDVGAATVALRK
ncbi:ribosomal L7Ae/L30e/S12e/Gadd45 family protein [Shouchella shacheensis]|uniref:ribosomal L7Ae/L30e/S12e/Gadd45 family protein n=1 Tax=Shouchella shacheensis TaxID=1649580 RepID=UPI00073FAA15|nr:ribosomal L7Ae/L30e/S12e/Gadd45 family protein [Shouchella shacheensis]